MYKFKLIDGDFSHIEALEVLLNLISSKIKFHSMEEFGIQIRNGGTADRHEKRIVELTKIRDEIKSLLNDPKCKESQFNILGNVEIHIS